MRRRREESNAYSKPSTLLGAVVFACALFAAPAHAALLPANFFDEIPDVSAGQAGVEADYLTYSAATDTIMAQGNVALSYSGYFATADRMVFNQTSRDLELNGNVVIVDPHGVEYTAHPHAG